MGIMLKITLPIITFGLACAFWGMIVGSAYVVLPQTEGTLMWCKSNNKMDQSICAPYSLPQHKNKGKQS